MTVGKKEMGGLVKQARLKKSEKLGRKYTQQMLARDVGKSQSYIGDLESGRAYPSYALLSKIAEVCDLPLSFFDNEQPGLWVKHYREQNYMTIEDLSIKSGTSIEDLEKIETGIFDDRTSLSYWMNIGKALGLTDEETMAHAFSDTMYSALFRNDGSNKDLNLIKNVLLNSGLYEDDKTSNKCAMEAFNAQVYPFSSNSIIMLPVYGSIAAGLPIAANQEYDEYYPLDTKFASINGYSPEDFFWLRVKGDSMEPGIVNGDLVLVRRQPIVDNGEIAVVLCDCEEATIKRVTVAGDKIILNPDNKKHPPQIHNTGDCLILGKVLKHFGDVR